MNMLGKHGARNGNRGLATPIDVDLQKEYAFEVSINYHRLEVGATLIQDWVTSSLGTIGTNNKRAYENSEEELWIFEMRSFR